MDAKYESILLSKPYTFIIGPQKKQFVMHEAAVARLSKTLDNLLHGGMKESKEHCVSWEDTDEKTFLRFGEWAYTGDYKPEEPEILLDASQIATTKDSSPKKATQKTIANSLASFKISIEAEATSWQHCGETWTSTTNTSCNSCRQMFVTIYCSDHFGCNERQYDSCPQCRAHAVKLPKRQVMIEKFNKTSAYASPTTPHTTRKNTESCEDYSEVFLSHAQLYVLADKYDIQELRNLSLHKLYVSLKEFVLYPDRMGDIVSLVRYSFAYTVESDKLRTLMKDFCACIVEDLSKGEGFEDLIYEAPDFACELIRQMSIRLD